VTSTRYMLAGIAVVGVLLCGCGPGPATIGAGPASTADPQLRGPAVPPPPRSAVGVAQGIAARWSAPSAPAFALNIPIEFRTVDYTATVFNAGRPEGFTAFITTRRTTLVTTASAATIVGSNGASPRFATPADQALWRAAGRPSLGQAPATAVTQTIPAGQYTFLPQGSNLTYRQAAALPADQDSLAAALADHLRAYAGPYPPASLELKQVAYLIATAPLTDGVRATAWRVMASLPGLRICQNQSGQAQPGAIGLCIDSAGDETLVVVNPGTGAIVTVADRLMQTSPAYPHVAAGTIVGSSTFLVG
jgi:hypothetical protein